MSVVKSITSPMKFLIQAGLLADLGKHIEQYGKKALIIADPFIQEKARKDSAGCFSVCSGNALLFHRAECTDTALADTRMLAEIARQRFGVVAVKLAVHFHAAAGCAVETGAI